MRNAVHLERIKVNDFFTHRQNLSLSNNLDDIIDFLLKNTKIDKFY